MVHNLAVFQQRQTSAINAVDDFPTPLWATRALMEIVMQGYNWKGLRLFDPCMGRGDMVRALNEYSEFSYGIEKYDYGSGYPACKLHSKENEIDYLTYGLYPECRVANDWIIANPPFVLGEEFILKALREAQLGVAMLVRNAFLETEGRYTNIYQNLKPNVVAQFVERVPMVQARIDPKISTATSYCWLLWLTKQPMFNMQYSGFMWIPPCRKRLEKTWDYTPVAEVGSM